MSIFPLACTQIMEGVETFGPILICSCDCNTVSPFSFLLPVKLANMAWLAGLNSTVPMGSCAPNWNSKESIYSTLLHSTVSELLVSHVKITSSPGQRDWRSEDGPWIWTCWPEIICNCGNATGIS